MVAATLKHLLGYSLEDWSPDGNWSEHVFTRANFSADISAKDLTLTLTLRFLIPTLIRFLASI